MGDALKDIFSGGEYGGYGQALGEYQKGLEGMGQYFQKGTDRKSVV